MFGKISFFKHFNSAGNNHLNGGCSFALKCLAVPVLLGVFTLCGAEQKKTELWLDHPHYKLPGPNTSGFSGKEAYSRSSWKNRLSTIDPVKWPRADKRPTPTADFMASGTPGKKGNVKFEKVPVELLEEAGVARKAQFNFGFPLPEGALFDLAQVRLTDGKNELPASFSVTGKYADNSFKWLMIRSAADLKEKEKKTLYVEFGSDLAPRKAPAKPLMVTTVKDDYVINNGVLSARINKKRFTFVHSIFMDGRYLGGINGFGALLILKDGKRMGTYKPVPRSVKLIESTPETAIFRVDGDFWDVKNPYASYTARITFRRNVPGFEVDYTFVNTNMRYEFLDIKSLTIGFGTGKPNKNKFTSWQHFKGDAPVPANAQRVVQLDDQTVSVDGKEIKARIPGGIKVTMADGMEMAITLADAWKRYPKGFSVEKEKNTVQVELLPVLPGEKFGKHLPYYLQFPFCGGAHRMKWGSSFTERINFTFGKKLSAEAAAAEADLPVIALLPPAWYAKAGVWRGMASQKLYAGIDKESLEIFSRNLKRREKHREYGAFNYGDSFGERSMQNWTNNEYDMSHGMFMFGLRTGSRDVLRYARAAARHEADVDVVHAYVMPYFVGCNIQHSCSHTGTYGKWSWPYRHGFNDGHSGHVWLRGMVDAWHLFGDGVAMDAAYLVGDHLNFAWLPGVKQLVQIRDGAWNLIALCEMAASTGDPDYRKGADKLAAFMMNLIDTKSAWYMNRTGQKGRGGIATFMCGIILNSLCDYYDLTQRKDIAEKCRDFAAWMVRQAFSPELGGLFWYDITPIGCSHFPSEFLNALIAPGIIRSAALFGDKQLFADGLMAFKALMMRHVPEDGKSVALHLLFHEDVFKAVTDYSRRCPGDAPAVFNRNVWRSSLADRQDGTLAVRGKPRFVIVPKKDNASFKIVWNNYNSAPGKTLVKKLTVTDPSGKQILSLKDIKPKTMREDFVVKTGKAGGKYLVQADCDSKSMWLIPGSKEYAAYHDTASVIGLLSNVGSRFEMEQLPGEKLTVSFTPLHMGRFGITVKEASGKVLFNKSGFKSETKLQNETRSVDVSLPAGKAKRKIYVEVFSGNGAHLRVKPAKLLSRP